jgi:Phospholipase_D-nuclease N-terminal
MQQGPPDALAGGIAAFFLLFWLGMVVLGLALTVLWIVALVDCAQREFPDSNEKIVWILVIAITHGIGALIYWFAGRPRGVKRA